MAICLRKTLFTYVALRHLLQYGIHCRTWLVSLWVDGMTIIAHKLLLGVDLARTLEQLAGIILAIFPTLVVPPYCS